MAIQSIFTPFPIDYPTCILGPYWSTVTNDDTNAFFLDQAVGYTSLFCYPTTAFIRPPVIQTWLWTEESNNHADWRRWSYRFEKTHGKLGKDLYIYNLINFCHHGISLDTNLLAAVSYFWSRSMNAFCFPGGLMSPTILNISALTGLLVFGDEITP